MEDDKILVSVCVLSYNHVKTIKRCLNSIVNQNVNFKFEVLIHDDNSTDGTINIIREFENSYPSVIRPVYEKENQYYKNNNAGRMDAVFNVPRAKGKYIAFCEGDDYWTDYDKLQKQVDFLETHTDYNSTYTRYLVNDYKTKQIVDNTKKLFRNNDVDYIEITESVFLSGWYTQYLTLMFRKDSLPPSVYFKYKVMYDWHYAYELIRSGRCAILNFQGGVYCMTGNGIFSKEDFFYNACRQLQIFDDVLSMNSDAMLLSLRFKLVQDLIEYCCMHRVEFKYSFNLILQVWNYNHNIKQLTKNIKRFLCGL